LSTGFTCRHLAVVGLGLMGGSLARALRPFAGTISGVEMNPQAREFAVANGVVDTVTDDLREGVSDADVVILAAPVRVIIDLLNNRIGSYLRSNTLLVDIGSTKRDICEAMGKLPIGIQAIGGHPMTGKESNGVQESDATLFEGRPFVLCASRRTTPATRDRALGLVAAIKAVPIEMDAHRHDHVVAAISHLPYLISSALVATVAQQGEEDDAVWRLAAGGFRDTSRLAAQDLNMMGDILSTNTQAVATLLAIFRMKLAMIEASLIAQENGKLVDLLRPTRDARIAWQKQQEAKK
jgi:prephenate dehydrogenase